MGRAVLAFVLSVMLAGIASAAERTVVLVLDDVVEAGIQLTGTEEERYS